MTTAIVCTALLGVLIVGLGMAVSLTRQRSEQVIGHSDDPSDALHKVVRAHGNSTEYAPMLALVMIVLGNQGPAAWVTWVMIAVVASRYLIVAGLLYGSLDAPNPMRFIGALGTYVGGFALCIALLLSV
jgi:uncharacterized membrane protein YecN with MAPEG domain